jgi:hypothetical protein
MMFFWMFGVPPPITTFGQSSAPLGTLKSPPSAPFDLPMYCPALPSVEAHPLDDHIRLRQPPPDRRAIRRLLTVTLRLFR